MPVPADYDGDGLVDVATWTPSPSGISYFRYIAASDGVYHPVIVNGGTGDIPVPKVYYGNTTMATFGVRHDASATYYLATGGSGFVFGNPGDIPIQRPVGQ